MKYTLEYRPECAYLVRYETVEILGQHRTIIVVEGNGVCVVVVYMRTALWPGIVPRRLRIRRVQWGKGRDMLRRNRVGHG